MERQSTTSRSLSLYLHVPFCRFRCAYCDFNTYAGLDHLIEPYVAALECEIRQVGAAGGRPRAHTVFLGGGTPSLLGVEQVGRLLAALREAFVLEPGAEVTLEANPGTVSRAGLAGLRELGVNRLSFGVQSSHPHELRLLDRGHLFEDAAQAVSWARAGGFESLNLDLIFALPHQTLADWQATVGRVLDLGPDHLSAYALSLEHGTPMRAWVQRGLLPTPDDDLAADMYSWLAEALAAHGYVQYEISNWARHSGRPALGPADLPDQASRHNVQYWRNDPYLGLGAGAHGYAAGQRYANVLAPAAYIARLGQPDARAYPLSPAASQATPVPPDEAMGETMFLGLRLVREGVSSAGFRERFGVDLWDRYGGVLERLRARGLIAAGPDRVTLTPAGRLLGNQVFVEFV